MRIKGHHDFGLTNEQFYELVDFYREILRLDEDVDGRRLRRIQQLLLIVFKGRIQKLIQEKKNELLRQLEGLEKL